MDATNVRLEEKNRLPGFRPMLFAESRAADVPDDRASADFTPAMAAH